MRSVANELAEWACELRPSAEDRELARRSLLDTLAVTVAAADDPVRPLTDDLPDAARWATLGHVLDFDDLHMESTTHVSVVSVPAVLAAGGGEREYLAAAGVMARLGAALGWGHYSSGWHATCCAGAPAAAAGAGLALGLDAGGIARAMALAVPAAGGVQRAFGTAAKSLQVGFAADAGVRAARLAAAGATADPSAVDQWLSLVGGNPAAIDVGGPAVPGGLAIKIFPCCYAMQRPISAVQSLVTRPVPVDDVQYVKVRTPAGTVQPLIHSRPTTGLQGKFSLEYAVATALLDEHPGFASFSDAHVGRAAARRLMDRVRVETTPGGDWLLAGEVEVEVALADGTQLRTSLGVPPGAPGRAPTEDQMRAKVLDCAGPLTDEVLAASWEGAADLLRRHLPRSTRAGG